MNCLQIRCITSETVLAKGLAERPELIGWRDGNK